MNLDANKVIDQLLNQIGQYAAENAMLKIQIAELSKSEEGTERDGGDTVSTNELD